MHLNVRNVENLNEDNFNKRFGPLNFLSWGNKITQNHPELEVALIVQRKGSCILFPFLWSFLNFCSSLTIYSLL